MKNLSVYTSEGIYPGNIIVAEDSVAKAPFGTSRAECKDRIRLPRR